MENQKEKIEVITPKLCPFISGFVLEPAKSKLGQMSVIKTTNINPCIEENCKFYNVAQKDCEVLLCFKIKREEIKQ